MNGKWMLAAMAVAAAAMTVSAHLPSPYDARFAIDRERELKSKQLQSAARGAVRAQAAAAWDSTKEYTGSYQTYQGDTVIFGNWNGKPLHWWAKFWSKGDKPGTPGAGGGTSPWVLINSESYGKGYTWQGYGPGGSIPNGQARVATWRYGASGAYTFTHDDIGSMPLAKSVAPAYDLAKDFPEIKQSWGVFVKEMGDEVEWDYAIKMVADGHEMFNHSWDHTSAADQYQWFYNKDVVPDFDPSIPYAIRGLTVKALWISPTGPAPWDNPAPSYLSSSGQTIGNCDPQYAPDPIRKLTIENEDIKIEGPAYWTGYSFSTDACIRGKVPMTVTRKAAEEITLPSGAKVYVKYTTKADISGLPEDGSGEAVNSGILYATMPAWLDPAQLDKYGENGWTGSTVYPTSVGGGVANDKGAPGLIASIFTVKAWTGQDWKRNIDDANKRINEKIYERIQNPGKYFAVGKRSEYYGYPMDAYSSESNDSLKKYGILQARAGSKTPQVMKGDFFHPYSIDFDAFYITQSAWTPASGGTNTDGNGWVYPDNPHIWLGLNQMVDSIVHHQGYMIREFHAVADIADGAWYDNGSPSFWPINSSGVGKGGWWGGITKNQLRAHYQYVKGKIDNNELVVYTASEAVKYRLTANGTSNPVLAKSGNDYTLNVTFNKGNISDLQIDEISVIVGIDATNDLNVEYLTGGGNPRLAPKKLDGNGSAWAVNFNPSKGGVKLIRGQAFTDPQWQGPDTAGIDPGNIDEDCDEMEDPNCKSSISPKTTAKKVTDFAFTGIRNGQINLRLNAGVYTAQLYNMQGRLVGSVNINAVGGVTATGLRTDNLAKGLFILHVKDAKGAAVLQHKLMLK